MALSSTSWAYPTTVTGSGWAVSGAGTLVSCVKTNNDANYAYENDPADTILHCSAWEVSPGNTLASVIPGGASPVGLELQVQCYNDGLAIVGGTQYRLAAQFGKDALYVAVSDVKELACLIPIASAPDVLALLEYGDPADTWGLSWTDVEAGEPYLKLYATNSVPLRGRYIDFVQLRVWYTDATVIGPTTMMGSQTRYLPGINLTHQIDPQARN
jgi:hypothetical protein